MAVPDQVRDPRPARRRGTNGRNSHAAVPKTCAPDFRGSPASDSHASGADLIAGQRHASPPLARGRTPHRGLPPFLLVHPANHSSAHSHRQLLKARPGGWRGKKLIAGRAGPRSFPRSLADGVMVTQGSLKPLFMVRIHVGQPFPDFLANCDSSSQGWNGKTIGSVAEFSSPGLGLWLLTPHRLPPEPRPPTPPTAPALSLLRGARPVSFLEAKTVRAVLPIG